MDVLHENRVGHKVDNAAHQVLALFEFVLLAFHLFLLRLHLFNALTQLLFLTFKLLRLLLCSVLQLQELLHSM